MNAIELLDTGAIAVGVTAGGRVTARAEVHGASDPATAARMALKQLPATGAGPIAVAAGTSDLSVTAGAADALASGDGIVLRGAPIPSGTAAAAAEAWTGAARGARHVVYFGVGDHTIAGILRNGEPLSGPRRAPAVAWLALNPVERDDYRRSGCLEAEVAAAGIVKRLIWRIKAGDRSRVQEAAGGELSAITLAHILAGARSGDGVAISVMRDTAKYLGMAAANLAVIADPEVLVLGGIMASAADLLLDAVRTEISRRLPPDMAHTLKIAPATLGVDGPAIGAARLASAAVQ